MSGFDLGDYVPVAERIVTFYELFPNGRIVCVPPEPLAIDGHWFITSTCSVWKYAPHAEQVDTPPDASASAWEPFPGKTPYTRDSEAMNAETSAIGRALGAAGVAVRRSLATSDEVQLRQGTPDGVSRGEAKGELLGAVHGSADDAKWWWQAAWPDNPERVPREELDAVCRAAASSASAPSAGGGDQSPEAAGDTGRENTEVSQSEPDAVDGQESGGSTHPAGPPSAAARQALKAHAPGAKR